MIWSAKLNNKLPQNVRGIRRSHKLNRENHEKLESGIDSKRKKLSWSEDPERYIPRRCAVIFAICNFHILRKCTGRYKLIKSQETINHLMYMDNIKLFAKNEKECETKACSENIQSGHKEEIWHRKMHQWKTENNTWRKEWNYQMRKN